MAERKKERRESVTEREKSDIVRVEREIERGYRDRGMQKQERCIKRKE
jgi:hypothetical protein